MAKNESFFLNINCVRAHRTFYARYDFAYDEVWVLSYGLKSLDSSETSALPSKGEATISLSNCRTGPQYKCPYCGNTNYVRCGHCKKLTCYSGSGDFKCDHCGRTGTVSGQIENISGEKRSSQGG